MEEPRKYFVVIYRPGSGWLLGKTIQDQPTAEHTAYMKQLQQAGRLALGGPFKDSTGAIAIIEFENLEAATKAVMTDPAVKTHLFSAEVHPWDPAATGRVEKRCW